jgi:3-oxoadipate enol-lactonase
VHQLRGLAGTLRPIAIDLPGHRGSDPAPEATLEVYAQTARDVLEQLQTGPALVAGHSLGGAVAQVLAAHQPSTVKGFVLISTCAKLPPAGSALRLLGLVPPPLRRAVLLSMARRVLFGPFPPWPAMQVTLEEIDGCRLSTLQNDAALGRTMDLARIAQELRVPTLILCGGRDRITPPTLSQGLNAMIVGSRLEIIPSAGHMLPLEAPDAVNRFCRDFFDAITGEARAPAVRPPRLREMLRRVIRRLLRQVGRWNRLRD